VLCAWNVMFVGSGPHVDDLMVQIPFIFLGYVKNHHSLCALCNDGSIEVKICI
jgi:hypothetical protein